MAKKTQYDSAPTRPAYDMPPPNAGLPYRNGLVDLCRAAGGGRTAPWAFTRCGAVTTFLDPELVEQLLDADPRFRGAVAAVVDRLIERARPADEATLDRELKTVHKHLERVFEDEVMMDLVRRWEEIAPLLARYAVAKEAARRVSPGRFPEPADGGED